MGNLLNLSKQIKENYIIKDEEADFYNMKGKGPYMTDSFGKTYLKPSQQPFQPLQPLQPFGYPGSYSLRGGHFYSTADLRYMNRLHRHSWDNPFAFMELQNSYNYYPNYQYRRG